MLAAQRCDVLDPAVGIHSVGKRNRTTYNLFAQTIGEVWQYVLHYAPIRSGTGNHDPARQ